MRELMRIYKESYEKLRIRHEQLTQEILTDDKRVALIEEEMDELQEVMRMMRPYVAEK
jgi:NADPH-dependent 7-cyano-7-deazaguanine reductase QueF